MLFYCHGLCTVLPAFRPRDQVYRYLRVVINVPALGWSWCRSRTGANQVSRKSWLGTIPVSALPATQEPHQPSDTHIQSSTSTIRLPFSSSVLHILRRHTYPIPHLYILFCSHLTYICAPRHYAQSLSTPHKAEASTVLTLTTCTTYSLLLHHLLNLNTARCSDPSVETNTATPSTAAHKPPSST